MLDSNADPLRQPKSREERRRVARTLAKQTGEDPKDIYAMLKRMEETRT